MSREEIQKLLGGYATDTLSEAERSALFEAALEDQELFDALAKEQALRDVLQEPFARRQLLDALGPARAPARIRAWQWLRQPAALAMAGGLAMLLIVAGLALRRVTRPAYREVILADVPAPPAKVFEPPPSPQKPKLQAVLPKPPVLHPEPQIADALLSRAMPAPAPPPADAATLARLTEAVRSADVARQLYSRANSQAMRFASGALPQTHAKMAPAAAIPSASNLGVRYSLLLKGADGKYAPTRFDTKFHPGDSLRLRLEPNDSGYVYLFQRESAGGWRLASTQRVLRGQPCLLPASGALQYDQPGRKELLLVFSTREEPSLVSLETAELDALAASASGDVLKATVSGGEIAYAVDMRPQAGRQKVAVEITLEFR